MTRLGTILNVVGALGVIAALAWAGTSHQQEPWREHQRRYIELVESQGSDDAKRAIATERIRPHEVSPPGLGVTDRCTTCHLGMEPGAESFEGDELFGPHPGELLHSHPISRFGCTSCHGGQGRPLDAARAHDRRHGGGSEAFTTAAVRCARCHPAAGMEGTARVDRGVALYFQHGCTGCHQPGRPGPGIGPNLASIGLRGGSYLRQVVLHPEKVYPLTIMPPMRYKIAETGPDIDALVAYLRTLEPWPAEVERVERRFSARDCTGCHRVADPADQPSGPGHACDYLLDEARWLDCAHCHGEREAPDGVTSPVPALLEAHSGEAVGAPEAGEDQPEHFAERFQQDLVRDSHPVSVSNPTGTCPHIQEAMSACGVCHREGER